MRLALDRADRRTFLAAAALLFAVTALTIMVAPSPSDRSEQPTTYSTDSKGAKAAWLLLQESGYRVERWRRELRYLPRERATLILAEPATLPSPRDADRLRRFVAEGGRVIITGRLAGAFLPDATVVPRPWISVWQKVRAAVPSAHARVAPEITLLARAEWVAPSSATPLYTDGPRIVVARYHHGLGEITWWASASPLTNAGLKEPGNVEFLLACVGGAGDGRVLFDEFFHGYGEGATGGVLQAAGFGWIALQASLLGIAVVLTFSRRSGPVFAPRSDARLSPIEFAQTLGSLYQRAGAASVALDICHQRFRYWLTRRLGVPGNTDIPGIERALRERWRFEDARFAGTLRACEAGRESPDLRTKEALGLVRALASCAARLRLFDDRLHVKGSP